LIQSGKNYAGDILRKILINGGRRLVGSVQISGAKNAALAILPAVVLADSPCRIENIPDISDTALMCRILEALGADVKFLGRHTVEIDPRSIKNPVANFDFIRHIRASYYFLGAFLCKFGRATVAAPGGCDFGTRPIDQHAKAFTALGAIDLSKGGIMNFRAEKLKGANIYFDVVSVGSTINAMLASCKAEGVTIIENAAKEPHVVDTANFLNSMGANIQGAGTDVIKIYGVKKLCGSIYSIIPDQIEAGTYMVAALASHGDVTVENVIPKHLESISAKLEEIGAEITTGDEFVRIKNSGLLNCCNIKTLPYPGFPTDMQPQVTALLSLANGTSIVTEGVWDNRFRYVSELLRMGANISADGRTAVIKGARKLAGNTVKAVDLRAGAAFVIAGLVASGKTIIENIEYIERGYEDIVYKLSKLGAQIKIKNFVEKNENSIAI
jgi:UDP-N-acetylglucosamine 1-carboxyvinyltransferase